MSTPRANHTLQPAPLPRGHILNGVQRWAACSLRERELGAQLRPQHTFNPPPPARNAPPHPPPRCPNRTRRGSARERTAALRSAGPAVTGGHCAPSLRPYDGIAPRLSPYPRKASGARGWDGPEKRPLSVRAAGESRHNGVPALRKGLNSFADTSLRLAPCCSCVPRQAVGKRISVQKNVCCVPPPP